MRFDPSPDIDDLVAADVRDQLLDAAREIAATAGRYVPRRTGHYAESVIALDDDRGVVVASNDPGAHAIELGSINNPTYAPLRRAGADVAKRFEPK